MRGKQSSTNAATSRAREIQRLHQDDQNTNKDRIVDEPLPRFSVATTWHRVFAGEN